MVHPITEDSPLYGFQQEDFQNLKGEFIVFIKAFDDMFSSTVVKRTSYTFDEVLYGAQFVSMFYKNATNSKTILDISRLNQTERIGL